MEAQGPALAHLAAAPAITARQAVARDVAALIADPRRLVRWSVRGATAILDQALFAISNFLLNVILARWLPPAEYGAFVAAYTTLLLVSVAHTALLSEPMLVFGAARYGHAFSAYFRVLQAYHWRLMLALAAFLLLIALGFQAFEQPLLAEAIAGLAIAAPCILLAWLARRACYPVSRPGWAAGAGAVNLAAVLIGIIVVERLGWLSVFSAQLVLAAAALAASVCLIVPLRQVAPGALEQPLRAAIWQEHWRYGRWSGASGALNWVHGYVYYLVLPLWFGLAATGALKALTNLVMPILQSDAAIATLLMPALARQVAHRSRFTRVVFWSAAAFALEACLYWILLVLVGERALAVLYDGQYAYPRSVLVLLGVVPLLSGLLHVLGNALRARERPEGVFWATAASVVVAGTFGVAATAARGVEGAVLGLVCGIATQCLVMGWLLARGTRA